MPCAAHATIGQRIALLHVVLGSTALSNLCQALDSGYLTSMAEITEVLVRKYPLPIIAMIKGHLDQVCMNQRYTQTVQGTPPPSTPPSPPTPPPPPNLTLLTVTPPALPLIHPGARAHNLLATCCSATDQVFTDQIGKFPTKSTASNTDILILFDYDSNGVHVEPMPSHSGYQILLAHQRTHRLLVSRGLRPRLQKLSNECSAALIHYLDKEAVEFQLAPPQVHHRNAAERAIRTWKNHFIAILCGCNRNFR